MFVLPNFPRTTSWLSEEEKQLAAWRLEEDIGEDDKIESEKRPFLHGAKLAFTDIKTWLLVNLSPSFIFLGPKTQANSELNYIDAPDPHTRLLSLRNKLLPNSRPNPALHQHPNPPPNSPALRPSRSINIRECLARR